MRGARPNDSLEPSGISSDPIARFLLQQLPSYVHILFQRNQHLDMVDVRLFNEHYVVKPPSGQGDSSFRYKPHIVMSRSCDAHPPCSMTTGRAIACRWHTDAQEQMAMCIDPRMQQQLYISAWCTLDDVSSSNGTLQVVPWDHPWDQCRDSSCQSTDESPDDSDLAIHAQPIEVPSGSVILFASTLWHNSLPNLCEEPRRVFYAQYSNGVLSDRPGGDLPLRWAVRCDTFGECGQSKGKDTEKEPSEDDDLYNGGENGVCKDILAHSGWTSAGAVHGSNSVLEQKRSKRRRER